MDGKTKILKRKRVIDIVKKGNATKKQKLLISLISLFIMLTVCSCSKSITNNVSDEPYKLGIYNQALSIFDDFIKSNPEDSRVKEGDIIEELNLKKISNNYFLISYKISPILSLTNYNYALLEVNKNVCKMINLNTDDYISDVSFDNGFILFYCDGRNTMNAFRDFPHNFKYDIEKGTVTKEYVFRPLTGFVSLGSSVNKIGLKSITEKDKTILFSFSVVKDTFLAGGAICPSIKIGSEYSNQEKNEILIDFENTILLSEAEAQLSKLKEKDYIKDVKTRTYSGMYDEIHLVIYFEFENIKEFSGKFETGDNGLLDFSLILK